MLWGLLACAVTEPVSSPELLEASTRTIEGQADRPVGAAVFAVGDVDGDGREDLGLGWPNQLDTLEGGSQLAVVTAASSVQSPYAVISIPRWVVSEGECDEPRLHGYSNVVGLGDLDEDGLGEVAVGFPGEGAGEVAVYTGARLAQGGALTLEDATWRILPGVGAWSFGVDLAVGDFDGDGVADLATSAPKTDDPLYGGEVYTLLGVALAAHEPGEVSALSLGARVSAAEQGQQLGERLAVVPDADGDGGDELAVLAPGCSQQDPEGFLTLLLSADLGQVGLDRALDDRDPAWSSGSSMRVNPLFLGDADGDGRGDLALGGVLAEDGSPRVRTFSGLHLQDGRLTALGEIELGADSSSQLASVRGAAGTELVGHDGGYLVRVPYPLSAEGWFKEGWVAPCLDQDNPGWMRRLAVGDFDGDGRDELAAGEFSYPRCAPGSPDLGIVAIVELD
jgi:hypothetical protein